MAISQPVHLPGDLVLLRGSRIIAELQRVSVKHSGPYYSHVAISVGAGVFIHSTRDDVHFVGYSAIFKSGTYAANWKVLRNQEIEERIIENANYANDILMQCIYYLGQKYNYWYSLEKDNKPCEDRTSFCSELAAKIYRQLGIKISDRPPEQIYPMHIAQLAGSNGWPDVTQLYKRAEFTPDAKRAITSLVLKEKDSFMKSLGCTEKELMELSDFAFSDAASDRCAAMWEAMASTLRNGVRDQAKQIASMNAVAEFLDKIGLKEQAAQIRVDMKLYPPAMFWDTPRPPKSDEK